MFEFEIERWVPRFVLKDKNGYAVAKAIEAAVQSANRIILQAVNRLHDYDSMPEWRLDEMAWEMNCWYDYKAPVETKREMVRNGAASERLVGTARGIENALAAIYPGSTVEEAIDYSVYPYHFRVNISLNEMTHNDERDKRAMDAIRHFQNLRSVLDGLIFRRELTVQKNLYSGLALVAARHVVVGCNIPPEFDTGYLTDAQGNLLLDGLGNRLTALKGENEE